MGSVAIKRNSAEELADSRCDRQGPLINAWISQVLSGYVGYYGYSDLSNCTVPGIPDVMMLPQYNARSNQVYLSETKYVIHQLACSIKLALDSVVIQN